MLIISETISVAYLDLFWAEAVKAGDLIAGRLVNMIARLMIGQRIAFELLCLSPQVAAARHRERTYKSRAEHSQVAQSCWRELLEAASTVGFRFNKDIRLRVWSREQADQAGQGRGAYPDRQGRLPDLSQFTRPERE